MSDEWASYIAQIIFDVQFGVFQENSFFWNYHTLLHALQVSTHTYPSTLKASFLFVAYNYSGSCMRLAAKQNEKKHWSTEHETCGFEVPLNTRRSLSRMSYVHVLEHVCVCDFFQNIFNGITTYSFSLPRHIHWFSTKYIQWNHNIFIITSKTRSLIFQAIHSLSTQHVHWKKKTTLEHCSYECFFRNRVHFDTKNNFWLSLKIFKN